MGTAGCGRLAVAMSRCVGRRRPLSRRGFWAAAVGVVCAGCRRETPEQSETHLRGMAEPWVFLKYPLRRAKERFEGRHRGGDVWAHPEFAYARANGKNWGSSGNPARDPTADGRGWGVCGQSRVVMAVAANIATTGPG